MKKDCETCANWKEVKPVFIPFKLPIETEEEADWLTHDLQWLSPFHRAYPIRERLNAIYSPMALHDRGQVDE